MITFNNLLQAEGIDPARVKLVRHQDHRYGQRTPYQLWRAADGRFELYQRVQGRAVFKDATLLASFVASPLNETLFVGMFQINGVGRAPAGQVDPASLEEVGGYNFYDLREVPQLADYRGRLIVSWGAGYRAWVQRAKNRDKPVVEIRRVVSEPPFPGFLEFSSKVSALASVPQSWRAILAAVRGVYLMSDPTSGKQYVGCAGGPTGFWGRWEDYVASGHGGNRRMRDLPPGDYNVSLLEIVSSSTTDRELLDVEMRWKQKLLSREFGLNAN